MDALLELIQRRRTIRRLRPDPVPDALIEALLDAAGAAPSAHNRQPWRFALLCSAASRAGLAGAMAERFRQDLQRDALSPAEIEARVAKSVRRITDAPLVIIACLEPADLDVYPDAERQAAEHTLGVQSVAAAIQNLLLAATQLGLGAGWMCAPLFCPEVARQALDLPSSWEPQALLTIGWPAEAPAAPPKRPRDTFFVTR